MPQSPLSPADHDGQRRREGASVRIVTNLDGDERTYRLAERAASPGARERIYELAEREALRSIDWGADDPRETEADRAAAEEVEALQARLADFDRWPDGAHCASDLPADYGLRDGPAEGHALKEPRAGLVRRRWLMAVGVAVVALVVIVGWLAGQA